MNKTIEDKIGLRITKYTIFLHGEDEVLDKYEIAYRLIQNDDDEYSYELYEALRGLVVFSEIAEIIEEADTTECLTSKYKFIRDIKRKQLEND